MLLDSKENIFYVLLGKSILNISLSSFFVSNCIFYTNVTYISNNMAHICIMINKLVQTHNRKEEK